MPSNQATLTQEDYSFGMNRDVAPHLIPANGVFDHVNGLTDESGSPFKRGGTANKSGAAFGTTGLRFLVDAYLAAGQRTVFAKSDDFGVLGSDDSTVVNLGSDGLTIPKGTAIHDGLLWIGGGFLYGGSRKTAAYTTGTVTLTNGSTAVTGVGTSWTANLDAGMLLQRGNERVYVIASVDSDTTLTLRDAYEGVTGAGVNYTANNIYKMTSADPYEISDYYAVAANRLCWLSGNKLRFAPLDATTGAPKNHSAWVTTDEHDLPDGAEGIGLAAIGATLLVFTTAGTWTLDGIAFDITDTNGNPQHRLNVLSRDMVLFGQTGIATWQQALVVPCTSGIFLVDGVSRPEKISHPIDTLYTSYSEGNRTTGQAAVFKGHYLLPIIDSSATIYDLLVCRLDRPTRVAGTVAFPWTHFEGDGGELTALAVRNVSGNRQPKLYGAQKRSASRVVDCTSFFTPGAGYKNDADGTTPVWDIISRDYETGNQTENAVRSLYTRYVLTDAASDNPEINAFYSLGNIQAGLATYGEAIYGTDVYAPEDGTEFIALPCTLGESAGIERNRCRINKKARYMRIRLRSEDPCSSLILRSLELRVRPSAATRN